MSMENNTIADTEVSPNKRLCIYTKYFRCAIVWIGKEGIIFKYLLQEC